MGEGVEGQYGTHADESPTDRVSGIVPPQHDDRDANRADDAETGETEGAAANG